MTLTVNQIPTHNHQIGCKVAVPPSAVKNEGNFKWFFDQNDKGGDGLVASDNIDTSVNNSFLVPDIFKNNIVGSTGSGQSHNNMPQYIGCVIWKRTA